MYLQITTRCNMACEHCCMSCRPGAGKHMDMDVVRQAINFASDYGECIDIGGGEPTIHPQFFDILKLCVDTFDWTWMATNGKKTSAMWRLDDILMGEDYPDDMEDDEGWDKTISAEGKLGVALSQDPYHEPIDPSVVDLWRRRGREIRNTSLSQEGVIASGRAKRTMVWTTEKGCTCNDWFIRPDGTIKACACPGSPVIGNVYSGVEDIWRDRMSFSERYEDTRCGTHIKRYTEGQLKRLKAERGY